MLRRLTTMFYGFFKGFESTTDTPASFLLTTYLQRAVTARLIFWKILVGSQLVETTQEAE